MSASSEKKATTDLLPGGSWDTLPVETNTFSPTFTSQGDWRVLGRRWLGFLYKLFRTLEENPLSDDVYDSLYQDWKTLSRQLIKLESPSVMCGYGGIFYLNRKRLLFRVEDWSRMSYVLSRMSAYGWGGVRIQAHSTSSDLKTFLQQITSPESSISSQTEPTQEPLSWISLEETKLRWERWFREEDARMYLRTSRGEQYAVWLYGRLLQWVQRRYNPLQQRPPQHQAHAILRAFIRSFESDSLLFFGFHMTEELTAYQSYHVTNTVVLSLMFGEALGFSRQQRLELGWAALEHDIGKLNIPTHLLHKAEPLSVAEIKEIEQLPIHTVKQLVGQEFAWERLKQALISMDIRLRPIISSPQRNADSGTFSLADEPSMVMSRIISLCACFDALCSQRPFRPAMKPVDALALMRGPLAQQFDPILLRRFVGFVWPVIKASNRFYTPKPVRGEPAEDPRPLVSQLSAPVVQELQRELQEYRLLKQVNDPTPDEQHRLQWLQRYLALKLQSVN